MGPYPDWQEGVTPHTDPKAQVRQTRRVYNRRVLRVTNASYRYATLSGTFELEDQAAGNPIQVTPGGKPYARVVCGWHGVTPRTEYPGLDLSNADYSVIADYAGEVADDIR